MNRFIYHENCIIDSLNDELVSIDYDENIIEIILIWLNSLHEENKGLEQCIDRMGGRLQGLWANYYENRWSIWSEAVEDVANELGFKIGKVEDVPVSNLKINRIDGVKKVDELVCENNLLLQENKLFKEVFEKTMKDAFDRNRDSKIAEDVIDYIHKSFYDFLKREVEE